MIGLSAACEGRANMIGLSAACEGRANKIGLNASRPLYFHLYMLKFKLWVVVSRQNIKCHFTHSVQIVIYSSSATVEMNGTH